MVNLRRALPYAEREERLTATGSRGEAEIVKTRVTGTVYDPKVSVEEWGTFRFLLRVTPEAGEPFDVRLHMRLPGNVSAETGTRFPVLFDPGDHGFMIVDPSIVPRTKDELLTAKLFTPKILPDVSAAAVEEFTRAAAERVQAAQRADDRGAKSPSPFGPNLQTQLDQLDQLKAAGLIDDARYEAKKQKLTEQL